MNEINKTSNSNGFTLIELIIVVAILAILMAVAIPNFVSIMDNSRKSADVNNAKYILETTKRIVAEDNRFAALDGSWEITKTDVIAIGTASTDFATELKSRVSIGQIVPKYKRILSGSSADRFLLEVTYSAIYDVKISASDGTNTKEIFPKTDTEYIIK